MKNMMMSTALFVYFMHRVHVYQMQMHYTIDKNILADAFAVNYIKDLITLLVAYKYSLFSTNFIFEITFFLYYISSYFDS